MNFIDGGVTAPNGFMAAGIYCGIRKNKTKKDLSLIYCGQPCFAAAVYTQNKVKGAPIIVTQKNLENGIAKAVICNSGIANTCNADGIEKAEATCKALAGVLNISPNDVIVASTGVIGQTLNLEAIKNGIPTLTASLSPDGGTDAAQAIMTTDKVIKEFAVEFELSGKPVRIGAMAKGSGMINPNMATMLCFITTDASICTEMLKKALENVTLKTFNRLSVDGDTSTNDMVSIMANGIAGNDQITGSNADFEIFCNALYELCKKIVRTLAKDGEGATKLLECSVSGCETEQRAGILAKTVIMSSLVKSAFFGADANWGRILCALGYANVPLDVEKIDVTITSRKGSILVCKNGAGVDFSEERAKQILLEDEILIDIDLKDGAESAMAWGCDLTYDYVKINGDYRT